MKQHTSAHWATDFLELAGDDEPDSVFECSTTRAGVTGGLCVTSDSLVLHEADATMRLRSADVRGWWDTPDESTFSLAIEATERYTVVLLSAFRAATVHAMTRAFGPGGRPDRLSA